jgi:hypothetical protein
MLQQGSLDFWGSAGQSLPPLRHGQCQQGVWGLGTPTLSLQGSRPDPPPRWISHCQLFLETPLVRRAFERQQGVWGPVELGYTMCSNGGEGRFRPVTLHAHVTWGRGERGGGMNGGMDEGTQGGSIRCSFTAAGFHTLCCATPRPLRGLSSAAGVWAPVGPRYTMRSGGGKVQGWVCNTELGLQHCS